MLELYLAISALSLAGLATSWVIQDRIRSKRRIRELQRQTLQAQRQLRQLGDLANEVAHEIKNPITAILCSAETLDLLIGDKIDEVNRRSLRYIKEYGDDLLRLLGDFLDLSRAQTGKLDAKQEPVRILPVVQSIVGLLESSAYRKQIAISADLGDEKLTAKVDPKHLKQIVFNLIHNAIKFTSNHGQIWVTATQESPHPFVRISVNDNGIGITSERIERLFEPYETWEENAEERIGCGLGLSLCKALVELNGGRIEIESKVGIGSCFSIYLPLHKQQITPRKRSSASQAVTLAQPLSGQRFLLIDEDSGSREATSRLIEAWGAMVDRVSLAVDALEAIQRSSYDAVMIDVSFKGNFAHELSEMIKGADKNTTVIITGTEDQGEKLWDTSDADKFVLKPLNDRALLGILLKSGKSSATQ